VQVRIRYDNATAPSNGRAATARFVVLPGETTIDLRVVVDRVIVEAFAQGGRVAFTKSFMPLRWQDSCVHIRSNVSGAVASAVDVWAMGCGWVGVDEQ
jgi:sucrose-6-phosphate hydrolase SacC (GH32 family)